MGYPSQNMLTGFYYQFCQILVIFKNEPKCRCYPSQNILTGFHYQFSQFLTFVKVRTPKVRSPNFKNEPKCRCYPSQNILAGFPYQICSFLKMSKMSQNVGVTQAKIFWLGFLTNFLNFWPFSFSKICQNVGVTQAKIFWLGFLTKFANFWFSLRLLKFHCWIKTGKRPESQPCVCNRHVFWVS